MPTKSIIPLEAGTSRWLCAALLLALATSSANAVTCRVAPDGANSNDGSTWSTPMFLQTALADANCTEIWVKKGIYTPVTPADMANVTDDERAYSFVINKPVYGGFAGNETKLSQRVPTPNLTVLSGDIDSNDANTNLNAVDATSDDIVGSNSYRVVTSNSGGIVLDALTVTGGKANGPYPLDRGGGIYCRCTATITNVTIIGNYAEYGGGLYVDLSSPTLHNVSVIGNNSGSGTGGMVISAYIPSGGGSSSPELSNVTFYGNAGTAGALSIWGANGTSFSTLLNVTFASNHASDGRMGGAISTYQDSGGTTAPTLSNVFFWGNTSAGAPSAISNSGGATPAIDHSVEVNSSSVGTLGANGGWTPTVQLRFDSPAIGAGDPGVCIRPPVNGLDQRGAWRFEGNNTYCDVGAMEFVDLIFADSFERQSQ